MVVYVVTHHLIGIVVTGKSSALRAADLGFNSHSDFSRLSHTSDLKIGTSVATLLCACCHRVSAGTGWLGVGIL